MRKNRDCRYEERPSFVGLLSRVFRPKRVSLALAVTGFLVLPALCFGSTPALFFSDLTSGPNTGWEGSGTKGAAVTVWGINLGSSGTVNIGGQTLSSANSNQVAEWGVTTNNAKIDVNTTLQRVTFWLNSSMAVGSTTITVTVGGVTSNVLPFTVRSLGSNKIYFIATNGSDSNDGLAATAGGGHGPWLHWYKADPSSNTNIIAGDTIYIRGGTYSSSDPGSGSAIEWRTGGNIGTSTHPIAFVGYPGDPYPVSTVGLVSVPRPSDGRRTQVNYVTFSKLQYTGRYSSQISWWGDGWRLVGLYFNNTSTASLWAATINPVNCENTYILGMKHVGGGWDYYAHVIYPNCGYWEEYRGDIRNFNIAYCEITGFQGDHSPYGGAALNFRRTGAGAVIDGVYIHHNYMHDSPYAQFLYCGENGGETNYYVYNNLIVNINQHGSSSSVAAFFAGFGSNNGDWYAYNNTVYESGKAFGVFWGYNGADWHLKNNIIVESSGYKFIASGTGSSLDSDHDSVYGSGSETYSGGSYSITNKLTSNPGFVNAGGGDFSIQAGSPCRDAGTSAVSGLVKVDMLGRARPQGAAFDIGAYEYTDGDPDPPPTDGTPPDAPSGLTIQLVQ